MDGLYWKTPLKWMIWGGNPLFSETHITTTGFIAVIYFPPPNRPPHRRRDGHTTGALWLPGGNFDDEGKDFGRWKIGIKNITLQGKLTNPTWGKGKSSSKVPW